MQRTRSQRRLADELEDDGIVIAGDDDAASAVIEELDHARRTPLFEGRRPVYGAMVTASPAALPGLGGYGLDLLDAPMPIGEARAYADGRAAFVVRDSSDLGRVALACFDRPLQFEADLVLLQAAAGAAIVQRTPVFGVTRLFQHDQVVSWDGHSWTSRPTAEALLPAFLASASDLDPAVARGLLHFAVHWLSPGRAGATLVVPRGAPDDSLDSSSAMRPPALRITDRRHHAPLLSFLLQHDLATLVDDDGCVSAIGVGLLASPWADAMVSNDRGMRHRSAQRWSYDNPEALIVVVSADGPVTVYRGGEAVASTVPFLPGEQGAFVP